MEKRRSIHGIFDGRFQIVHKGHEIALQEINNRYEHICIGIINPDPRDTLDENFSAWDNYKQQDNPFTYFQRVYLLDSIMRYNSIKAVVVPHWCPVPPFDPEFLPYIKSKREWFIPVIHGERGKKDQLINSGESISEWDVSGALSNVNSSHLREDFNTGKYQRLKRYIPDSVLSSTLRFLEAKRQGGEGLDEEFIVIPILEDNIHPLLLCGGIQLATDNAKRLIYAPIIKVSNNDKWWEGVPLNARKDEQYFTFYQIYEIINEIMDSLRFYDYFVSPILINKDKPIAVDSFLPNNRLWYWQDGVNNNVSGKDYVHSLWRDYCSEECLQADIKNIRNEMYFSVCEIIHDSFNRRNYYSQMKTIAESKTVKETMNLNTDALSEESQHSFNDTTLIQQILSSDSPSLSSLFSHADRIFANRTAIDMQKIILPVLKASLKSQEEKNMLLDRLKESSVNIAASFVAYMLVQLIDKNEIN